MCVSVCVRASVCMRNSLTSQLTKLASFLRQDQDAWTLDMVPAAPATEAFTGLVIGRPAAAGGGGSGVAGGGGGETAAWRSRGTFLCQVPGCGKVFSFDTNCRRHERREHQYFRSAKETCLGRPAPGATQVGGEHPAQN